MEELKCQVHVTEDEAGQVLNELEEKLNHGLVSSCLLLKRILKNKGLRYFNSDYYPFIKKSAIAKLMHHYKPGVGPVPLQISVQSLPLLTMLILCDEIQEWNRPLDDIGLDLAAPKLLYKLERISTESNGDSLIFDIRLSVHADPGVPRDRIKKDVTGTLGTKKERFKLISAVVNKQALKNIRIDFQVSDENKRIGDIIHIDLLTK